MGTLRDIPLICWLIEGEIEVTDGSRLEIKVTLRNTPTTEDFLAFKEGAKTALEQQSGCPIVSDSISLSRANGHDWW